jgi:hypothetical protein
MSCGCSSSGGSSNGGIYPSPTAIPNVACDITQANLNSWKNSLECVKLHNKLDLIGLVEFNANQFLGVLQSALNYPDNYCLYKAQLDFFKDNVLINIVANVPECI